MIVGGCESATVVETPPSPADRLEFRAAPTQATAGLPFDPAVQVVVRRFDGSIDVTSTATISLTVQSATAPDSLRGATSVTAVGGVATFTGLSLLRASATTRLFARADGLTGAESAPLSVVHGAPAQIVFRTQPAGATAGQPLAALSVQVRDVGGNRVTSASGPVTIAIATGPPGATLTGTVTADLVAGEASLGDVRLPRAGSGYTLTASLVGNPAVLADITRVFTTVPAAPAELAFVTEPTASLAGVPITPAVRVAVLDAFGNLVTNASAPITLGFALAPTATQLLGTTTVTPTDGIARFADLRVDRIAANVRLRASAPGLPSATSILFAVGAP